MGRIILTVLLVCGFSQLASSKNQPNIKKINSPVACCEGRAEGGVRGTSTYTVVVVKACVTSDISYQDAQARACSKAGRLANLALNMSMDIKVPVTIEGGN